MMKCRKCAPSWRLVLTRHLLCHRLPPPLPAPPVPPPPPTPPSRGWALPPRWVFKRSLRVLPSSVPSSTLHEPSVQRTQARDSSGSPVSYAWLPHHCPQILWPAASAPCIAPVSCSSPNCSSPRSPSCVVGSCAAHCSHPQMLSRSSRSSTSSSATWSSKFALIEDLQGPVLQLRGYIQSAAHRGALSIARVRNVSSIPPQMGWGRQPLNFNVATFNARRLWLSDHSVHDGFHMLVNLLTDENVEVLCVQEVFAGDFPSLPPSQKFHI